MALGIQDVLLRITGDEKDARRALDTVATELAAFSKISAEASAEVETAEAEQRLKELRYVLEQLDEETANPKIKTDIALVLAQIEEVQQELRELDAADVDVEVRVEMERSILDRMQSLTTQTGLMSKAMDTAAPSTKSFFSGLGSSTVNMGAFTTQVRYAIPLIGALSAVIVSVVGGLAALVSSLAFAVAGAGALAIAFGGALVPAIGAGFLAVQRFKEEADKAGTPAHALAQAFGELKDATAGLQASMDPIFRGMASAVRAAAPVVASLKDEFRTFAQAAGDAFRIVGDSIKRMKGPIQDLVAAAGPVFKQLARIATGFGETLLNIANAAMPFLVDGLRQIGDAMKDWSRGTGNAAALSGVIGTLVGHLEAWLELGKQVGRVFLNFFTAAAPAGKELVEWLSQGAEKLADFLGSAEGQDKIKQFLDDVIPLFKEVVEFVGKLGSAFVKLGQLLAPIFTPVVQGINFVLDAINWLLDLLNKIPADARQVIGVLLSLATGFGLLSGIARIVAVSVSFLIGVFGAIGDAVGDAVSTVADGVADLSNSVKDVPPAMRSVADEVREGFAPSRFNNVRNAGKSVANMFLSGLNAEIPTVGKVARQYVSAIKGGIGTMFSWMKGAGERGGSAFANGLGEGVNMTKHQAQRYVAAVKSGVRDLFSWMRGEGEKDGKALADGVGSKAGDARNAGKKLGDGAKQALDPFKGTFLDTGRQLGSNAGQGIARAAPLAQAAGKNLATAAINAVRGISSGFLSAGIAVGSALADGIRNSIPAVAAAADALAAAARKKMPGSEPEDKSSPLYGLKDSGRAIVMNMVEGLEGTGSLLASSLAKELAHSAPILRAPMQATQKAAAGAPVYHQTFDITTPDAGTTLDPRAAAMQLALLQRQRGVAA